jgi:hypothetical protein
MILGYSDCAIVKFGFRDWRLHEQHVFQHGIWALNGDLHENHTVQTVMC